MIIIYQFKDKNTTIKHLGNIIEAKKINTQTIKIKESITQGIIGEDLLYYEKEEILDKDMKNLWNKLNDFMKKMHDIQKEKQMGFVTAAGEDDGHHPDEE
jgi:hypothetical protein